jgi:hypothetical protein
LKPLASNTSIAFFDICAPLGQKPLDITIALPYHSFEAIISAIGLLQVLPVQTKITFFKKITPFITRKPNFTIP